MSIKMIRAKYHLRMAKLYVELSRKSLFDEKECNRKWKYHMLKAHTLLLGEIARVAAESEFISEIKNKFKIEP